MIFQVTTGITMTIRPNMLYDVMPRSLADMYQSFGATFCLHLQCSFCTSASIMSLTFMRFSARRITSGDQSGLPAARKEVSCVWVPLALWMCVSGSSVVLTCAGRGLTKGWTSLRNVGMAFVAPPLLLGLPLSPPSCPPLLFSPSLV
jgi:hypothetical protein